MSKEKESSANLALVIKQAIENRLKDLHTSMPGIIENFDPVNQTASVQPAIKRVFKLVDENAKEFLTPTDLPILINVPIQFPRGGGYSLTFPVKKGDECLLVFSERAIDTWHKDSGVQTPNAKRFHSLSDATCFVGLSSLPNKVPDYNADNTQLKKDDGSAIIELKQDEIECTANADVKVTAPTITCTASTTVILDSPLVECTGDLNVSGVVSAPTIQAATNLTVAGKEQADHTHSAGSYVAGATSVSGVSGAQP